METIRHFFYPRFMIKAEYVAIVFCLLIFLNFPVLSRYWDSSSAAIDAGALSAIVMAVLALLSFKAVTWWLLRSLWPVMANYSRYHFESNFQSLSPCYKVFIFLGFYLLLLFSFVCTLAALV